MKIAPEAIFVTDSKCVYDAAGNNQPCDDQRSASEMPVFLELVARTAGRDTMDSTITIQQLHWPNSEVRTLIL